MSVIDFMLSKLNDTQKRVATTVDSPMLVVAGPGTGKTYTIAHRIAFLVQQGAKPESILAVTFTNRAARELKTRTEMILGERAQGSFIGTFHLLGLKIIKECLEEKFIIYNRDDQVELLKALLSCSTKKALQIAEAISRKKNNFEDSGSETWEVYEIYHAALRERHAYDFDDLILIPLEIFERESETKKRFQNKFKHIIIDEYQDINTAQYRLVKILSNKNGMVCAVGDADQAIYAFRGADVQSFLNFDKDFQHAKQIVLTENYRSTSTIINAGQSVIENNQKRISRCLNARHAQGKEIGVISVPDEYAEVETVIQEIEARIGGTSNYQLFHSKDEKGGDDHRCRFADFGVLCRTNAQLKIMEERFNTSGIPYQLVGTPSGAVLQEREETLAYLRSLINSDDSTTSDSGDLQEAKLLCPPDLYNPRADAVTIMTMHMAKGLEFAVVFIAGCEDGLIPYTVFKDDADIEEERRLFYVAMTRAKKELVILHSRRRFIYGRKLMAPPSVFLAEIPRTLIRCSVIQDKVKRNKYKDKQIKLL